MAPPPPPGFQHVLVARPDWIMPGQGFEIDVPNDPGNRYRVVCPPRVEIGGMFVAQVPLSQPDGAAGRVPARFNSRRLLSADLANRRLAQTNHRHGAPRSPATQPEPEAGPAARGEAVRSTPLFKSPSAESRFQAHKMGLRTIIEQHLYEARRYPARKQAVAQHIVDRRQCQNLHTVQRPEHAVHPHGLGGSNPERTVQLCRCRELFHITVGRKTVLRDAYNHFFPHCRYGSDKHFARACAPGTKTPALLDAEFGKLDPFVPQPQLGYQVRSGRGPKRPNSGRGP